MRQLIKMLQMLLCKLGWHDLRMKIPGDICSGSFCARPECDYKEDEVKWPRSCPEMPKCKPPKDEENIQELIKNIVLPFCKAFKKGNDDNKNIFSCVIGYREDIDQIDIGIFNKGIIRWFVLDENDKNIEKIINDIFILLKKEDFNEQSDKKPTAAINDTGD